MRSSLDGFLTPEGEFIKLNQTHIQTVIDNPEFFGLTQDYIINTYNKHNKNIGIEGDARREILIKLIKDGWTRVNYDERKDRFIVNIWLCDGRVRKSLEKFALNVSSGSLGMTLLYSDIFLQVFCNGSLQKTNIQNLIKHDHGLQEIGSRSENKKELF